MLLGSSQLVGWDVSAVWGRRNWLETMDPHTALPTIHSLLTLSTHLKKVAVPCSLPASYILSSESPWGVLSTAGPWHTPST